MTFNGNIYHQGEQRRYTTGMLGGYLLTSVLIFLVFLIIFGKSRAVAEEPEHLDGLPVMSDSELKTEGAATRKPASESKPSGEMRQEKDAGLSKDTRPMNEKTAASSTNVSGMHHSLSIGIGRLWGAIEHTTGAVTNITGGGRVIFNPSVKTELPLDAYMLSISDTITFSRKWEASLCLKKSFLDDTGTAEAWERGIYYSQITWWPDPNSLDIKWEADSELDALFIELDVTYNILNHGGLSLSAGIGYILKKFEFDVDNMVYYTPSLDDFLGVDSGAQPVPRMLRQFSFTYEIPYVEIITSYRVNETIGISAGFGYAPRVFGEHTSSPMPIDDSFNGYLDSDGTSDGNAIMVAVEGDYKFYEHWVATLKADYMKTDTNGSESRYYSGLWALDVENDMESEEIYIALEVAYVF